MQDRTWSRMVILIARLRLVTLFCFLVATQLTSLQVLNGFESENGVFILYVTDYTKNDQAASCQAPWCPVGLNEYVLLFNLWQEAATQGRKFEPQTYWAVRNARMIRSNNGFVEGKLVETKFGQVDSDDDYPPLQALLEYVAAYSPHDHKLIIFL